jgi:DNA-directed RNA polymerase subunit M/transcription elongation factor TFIIS
MSNLSNINCDNNSQDEDTNPNPLKKLKSNNNCDEFNKKSISSLISVKSDRVKYIKVSGNSNAWKQFQRVLIDGKETLFVKCNSCNIIYKYDTRNCSTAVLAKHKCSTVDKNQMKLNFGLKVVSTELKSTVAESAALCCAIDMRPFNLINGKGFSLLAKSLIKVGAKYGENVDIKEVLPSNVTVSRKVRSNYEILLQKVIEEVSNIKYFGVTCDHWVHDAHKTNYVTVTVQYLINDKIKSRVLATKETPDKMGSTTLSEINNILSSFNIPLQNVIFVTDNASSMKLAFRELQWIGCASHNLNLVQKHAFKEIENFHELRPIVNLLENSKELVKYFKHSGLQNRLKTTLKQMIEVRWDSRVQMLESIKDNYSEIKLISLEKEKVEILMQKIKEPLLSNLIALLKPLRDARVELCSENTPTLHLVLPNKMHLIRLYQPKDSDDISIKSLKEKIVLSLYSHFAVTKYHESATFFVPAVKSLKNLLTDEKIKELHKFIIKLIKDIKVEEKDKVAGKESQFKLNNCLLMFADNENNNESLESPEMELEKYINSSYGNEEPIKFWKENEKKFPRLSILANKLFSVPATNLSSERNFNFAGLTLTDRRSQIDPENVDKLLFIRSNYYTI